MRSLLVLLVGVTLAPAQAPRDTTPQPASKPRAKNSTIKPQVIVVPKSREQERAENWALIGLSVDRYKGARAWLEQMTAKYKNDVGEDENHVLGRHYAELENEYQKMAVPIGERLIEDLEYFGDDGSPRSTLDLNTMVVDALHLDFILAGLQTEDRKWLRVHAKDRIEPGVVIVVK